MVRGWAAKWGASGEDWRSPTKDLRAMEFMLTESSGVCESGREGGVDFLFVFFGGYGLGFVGVCGRWMKGIEGGDLMQIMGVRFLGWCCSLVLCMVILSFEWMICCHVLLQCAGFLMILSVLYMHLMEF